MLQGAMLAHWWPLIGEEFLIVCQNTQLEGAITLANNLRENLLKETFPTVSNLTASFGTAQHHAHEEIATLFQRIDKALYKAKENGRNCVIST